MNKVTFYILGVIWMITGIISIAFIGAVDWGAPLIPSYIGAVAWGSVSFATLWIMNKTFH